MPTSSEGSPSEASVAAGAAGAAGAGAAAAAAAPAPCTPTHEPLACVSCRSRKLKCDRQKPACSRCAKAAVDCVYPESRRKPAFKRRNVRELEERLAQVEGLLRSVGKQRAGQPARPDAAGTEASSPGTLGARAERPRGSPPEGSAPWFPLSPTETPRSADDAHPAGDLLGLGQFESLPPFEMIEDLHRIYFSRQHSFLPIIHPGNYLRSFHSPPHMRPPMCLQYAIWTVAANGDPKYGYYHGALYRRARQYLEADELKGLGEHFITVAHAQAWALIATDEARCLLFTRASMSSARSVRLSGMMGLHRLDSALTEEEVPMAPMIAPPKSWAELEERRRVFWGGFCIDSYASVCVGWPTLIDINQVTTRLPASNEAFSSGVEEHASSLQEVFRGASYSNFASNVVTCHLLNQIMKHAHRPMPDDRPEDPEFGPFWKRHRELDNMLSSAFMFLPERFRLPRNLRDPNAVQINLSLHASVICLHNAASEKAEKFKLMGLKQTSCTRSLTAAREIVDIMKLTCHLGKAGHKGPLVALALYCAGSVYISQAKENPERCNSADLELLINSMEAIKQSHPIIRAYLNQLLLDIERNGISVSLSFLPRKGDETERSHIVPLVARNSASRHTKIQPPLPAFLPLKTRQGAAAAIAPDAAPHAPGASFASSYSAPPEHAVPDHPASKRMRTSGETGSDVPTLKNPRTDMGGPSSQRPGGGGHAASRGPTDSRSAAALFGYASSSDGWSYATKHTTPSATLPHRTGSLAMDSQGIAATAPSAVPSLGGFPIAGPPEHAAFAQLGAGTSFAADAAGGGNTNNNSGSDMPDLDIFQNLGDWDVADSESLYAMLTDVLPGNADDFGSHAGMDLWASWNSGEGSGPGSA